MNDLHIDNRIMDIIKENEKLRDIVIPLYDAILNKIIKHDFQNYFMSKGVQILESTKKVNFAGCEFNISFGQSIDIKNISTDNNFTFNIEIKTEIFTGYVVKEKDIELFFSKEYWGLSKYRPDDINKVLELGNEMLEKKKASIQYLQNNQDADKYSHFYYECKNEHKKFKTYDEMYEYVMKF